MNGPGRLVGPGVLQDEEAIEAVIRPRRLDEFVGQQDAVRHLSILLKAAKSRNSPPDHILLAGPPGLGKTTLAGIVANEMGADLKITSGPAILRPADLAAIVSALHPGAVLFVDEIHRLPRPVEEMLYSVLEDFHLDLVLGRGPGARSHRVSLERFTFVGATTRSGLLSAPLRDRFGFTARLEPYSETSLAQIVQRTATIIGLRIEPDAALVVAGRGRGTPRIVNRLLRRVQDYAEVEKVEVVDVNVAVEALEAFGVDDLGLDNLDRHILEALCVKLAGRPVGIGALAQIVGEEPETIADVYEPFLVRQGLVIRTPRGRIASAAAYQHLGLRPPADNTPGRAVPLFDTDQPSAG